MHIHLWPRIVDTKKTSGQKTQPWLKTCDVIQTIPVRMVHIFQLQHAMNYYMAMHPEWRQIISAGASSQMPKSTAPFFKQFGPVVCPNALLFSLPLAHPLSFVALPMISCLTKSRDLKLAAQIAHFELCIWELVLVSSAKIHCFGRQIAYFNPSAKRLTNSIQHWVYLVINEDLTGR